MLTQPPASREVEAVRALVESVTRALVDKADAAHVTCTPHGDEFLLNVAVDPNDLGKVIGKQGKTARALRQIVLAAGTRLHLRFVLEIEVPSATRS